MLNFLPSFSSCRYPSALYLTPPSCLWVFFLQPARGRLSACPEFRPREHRCQRKRGQCWGLPDPDVRSPLLSVPCDRGLLLNGERIRCLDVLPLIISPARPADPTGHCIYKPYGHATLALILTGKMLPPRVSGGAGIWESEDPRVLVPMLSAQRLGRLFKCFFTFFIFSFSTFTPQKLSSLIIFINCWSCY